LPVRIERRVEQPIAAIVQAAQRSTVCAFSVLA
jgi:hypothetical protein